MVTSLKYLVRVLMSLDDDWLEVVGNLQKSRKSWARLPIILGMEGDSPMMSGIFFKAVVQAVLLFGAETWLMPPPPRTGQALGVSNTGL